jgi:hypothetical protein
MRKHLPDLKITPSAALLLFGLCVATCAPDCRGTSQERIPDQLVLARVCASEVGLQGAPEECAAIHATLVGRAAGPYRGASFAYAAGRYSAGVFDIARRDGRAWVAHLRPDGHEPEGWPTVITRQGTERRHAPWHAFRGRWMALYEAAGRVLAGEVTSACGGRVPDHWGMRTGVDWERATRAEWIELECTRADGSPTRNAFWRVPERVSSADVD